MIEFKRNLRPYTKIAEVDVDRVTLTTMDARRRLLFSHTSVESNITVGYSIATPNATAAATITTTIKARSPANVVEEMKTAGLTLVTAATVTALTIEPSSPPPSTSSPHYGRDGGGGNFKNVFFGAAGIYILSGLSLGICIHARYAAQERRIGIFVQNKKNKKIKANP